MGPRVRVWRERHPVALAGCRTLDEVLAAITRNPDPTLAVLLGELARGDRLAGRVVVQSLLPKLLRMARCRREYDLADWVSWLWLRARTYPLDRRPRRIAANLVLDTLSDATRSRTKEIPWDRIDRLLDDDPHDEEGGEPSAEQVIHAAVALGLVEPDAARVLDVVYVQGLPGRSAAEVLGISLDMVRWRCSVTVRRLRAHADALRDAA